MTNQTKLENLIKNYNPFIGNHIVTNAQIWGKSFPDVPIINAHASNEVFKAIQQIRNQEQSKIGITITGEKGLGKSHLISRIRHTVKNQGDVVFIYLNKYDNLDNIHDVFLKNVVSNIRAFGQHKNVMQWQEIATDLINLANQERNWNYPPQTYINKMPEWLNNNRNVINTLQNKILHLNPSFYDSNYLIKAILWTLSEDHKMLANHWLGKNFNLSCQDLEIIDQEMGLPNSTNLSQTDINPLESVRQIFKILSYCGKIPLICFDELDNINYSQNGFTTAQIIANLAKDLYNTIESGVIFLTMYPETWRDQIRSLPQTEAVVARLVSQQIDQEPIKLNYLNYDQIKALVATKLKHFFDQHQQQAPSPLYPFDERALQEFAKSKPTMRALFRWCADNFKYKESTTQPQANTVESQTNLVENAFNQELSQLKLKDYWQDNNSLAQAISFNLKTLINQTVENVKIEKIEPVNDAHINFKIVGMDNDKTVKIGVVIAQYTNGHSINAALNKLVNYQRYDFTRGCFIRSERVNTNTQAHQKVRDLLHLQGGEWVLLKPEEIKPLLAIFKLWENREQYNLTIEEINKFIIEKRISIDNHLIKDILSDPANHDRHDHFGDGLPISIPGNNNVQNS